MNFLKLLFDLSTVLVLSARCFAVEPVSVPTGEPMEDLGENKKDLYEFEKKTALEENFKLSARFTCKTINIDSDDGWIKDKEYVESIYEVIPEAIRKCDLQQEEFSEERICKNKGLVTFNLTPNDAKYGVEQWNAMILYNVIYRLHRDKYQCASCENDTELMDNLIDTCAEEITKWADNNYHTTLQETAPNYVRTIGEESAGDIKRYAKALNLYKYIKKDIYSFKADITVDSNRNRNVDIELLCNRSNTQGYHLVLSPSNTSFGYEKRYELRDKNTHKTIDSGKLMDIFCEQCELYKKPSKTTHNNPCKTKEKRVIPNDIEYNTSQKKSTVPYIKPKIEHRHKKENRASILGNYKIGSNDITQVLLPSEGNIFLFEHESILKKYAQAVKHAPETYEQMNVSDTSYEPHKIYKTKGHIIRQNDIECNSNNSTYYETKGTYYPNHEKSRPIYQKTRVKYQKRNITDNGYEIKDFGASDLQINANNANIFNEEPMQNKIEKSNTCYRNCTQAVQPGISDELYKTQGKNEIQEIDIDFSNFNKNTCKNISETGRNKNLQIKQSSFIDQRHSINHKLGRKGIKENIKEKVIKLINRNKGERTARKEWKKNERFKIKEVKNREDNNQSDKLAEKGIKEIRLRFKKNSRTGKNESLKIKNQFDSNRRSNNKEKHKYFYQKMRDMLGKNIIDDNSYQSHYRPLKRNLINNFLEK